MRPRALFVVSARGQGHLVRCRALSCELASRGWASTMTSKSPLSAASYDVSIVDLGEDEAAPAVYDALKDKPVVAIVDTPGGVDAPLVVFGSAGADHTMVWSTQNLGVTLFGAQYALLRPEFREARAISVGLPSGVFDCREVQGLSAATMASRMRTAGIVTTYGGMRALEAACVRGNAQSLVVQARNPGEALNKAGLEYDPGADLVDGLGCSRVADAIEDLVK